MPLKRWRTYGKQKDGTRSQNEEASEEIEQVLGGKIWGVKVGDHAAEGNLVQKHANEFPNVKQILTATFRLKITPLRINLRLQLNVSLFTIFRVQVSFTIRLVWMTVRITIRPIIFAQITRLATIRSSRRFAQSFKFTRKVALYEVTLIILAPIRWWAKSLVLSLDFDSRVAFKLQIVNRVYRFFVFCEVTHLFDVEWGGGHLTWQELFPLSLFFQGSCRLCNLLTFHFTPHLLTVLNLRALFELLVHWRQITILFSSVLIHHNCLFYAV